jgi:hypothetical protein
MDSLDQRPDGAPPLPSDNMNETPSMPATAAPTDVHQNVSPPQPRGEVMAQAEEPQSPSQAPRAPFEDEPTLPDAGHEPSGDGASPGMVQPPLPPDDDQDEAPPDHMAIQLRSTPPLPPDDVEDSEPESSAEEEDDLVGPVDPDSCIASGPGVTGGAAGTPLTVKVQARDDAGKKVLEGGAYVQVLVRPSTAPLNAEPIAADITDNGDGTYSGVYTVPTKGDYEIRVEVNGQEIGDSPFPVYFSAVQAGEGAGAGVAGVAVGTGGGLPPGVSGAEVAAAAAAASMSGTAPAPLSVFPNMAANYRLSLVCTECVTCYLFGCVALSLLCNRFLQM